MTAVGAARLVRVATDESLAYARVRQLHAATLRSNSAMKLTAARTTMKPEREPVVLGWQLAEAREAEAARLAAGTVGPSPMPEGEYDAERGDYNLVVVTSLVVDAELRALTKQFRTWEPQRREDTRRSISMDEQYTLIHFAKRSAVLALSEGSPERCEDGFTALSMIDETRIDPRDAAWAAGILSYAVTATRAERKKLFDQAIVLSTPGMAGILKQSGQSADLSDWGHAAVRTNQGVGLIRSGGARYEPTLNLDEIALKIANWLDGGRYVADPEIAVDVPAIWFAKERRTAVQKALERARGAVAISGTLREGYSHEATAQMFIQWIAEMPTAGEAQDLVKEVGNGTPLDRRFSVGVSMGRLFGLLVAGSSTAGVEPFESRETLANLAEQTRTLLAEATAARQ